MDKVKTSVSLHQHRDNVAAILAAAIINQRAVADPKAAVKVFFEVVAALKQ